MFSISSDPNVRKHVSAGEVLCLHCRKINRPSEKDTKKGEMNCTRCGKKITVAK